MQQPEMGVSWTCLEHIKKEARVSAKAEKRTICLSRRKQGVIRQNVTLCIITSPNALSMNSFTNLLHLLLGVVIIIFLRKMYRVTEAREQNDDDDVNKRHISASAFAVTFSL